MGTITIERYIATLLAVSQIVGLPGLRPGSGRAQETERGGASRGRAHSQQRMMRDSNPEIPGVRFGGLWSGCRGSNPVYMTPSHAYYRYTTARIIDEIFCRASGIFRVELQGEARARVAPHDPSTRTTVQSFGRAAGNRTQSTRTRSVRTTGILQPG